MIADCLRCIKGLVRNPIYVPYYLWRKSRNTGSIPFEPEPGSGSFAETLGQSSFFKMSKKECHGYRLDRALIFTTVNETKLTEIGPGLQRRKIDFTCRHLISSYD